MLVKLPFLEVPHRYCALDFRSAITVEEHTKVVKLISARAKLLFLFLTTDAASIVSTMIAVDPKTIAAIKQSPDEFAADALTRALNEEALGRDAVITDDVRRAFWNDVLYAMPKRKLLSLQCPSKLNPSRPSLPQSQSHLIVRPTRSIPLRVWKVLQECSLAHTA